MCIFTSKKIEIFAKRSIEFHKLIYNKKCYYDEFIESVGNNNKNDLKKLLQKIDWLIQGHDLPDKYNKKIKTSGIKLNLEAREFKAGILRLYYFKDINIENRFIVVLGGTKQTQKKDIKRFINILKKYLNVQKEINNDKGRTSKK